MEQTNVEAEKRFPISFPEEEAKYVTDAIRSAHCILEYGSGGTTWFAAGLDGKRIVSVESDAAWAKELSLGIANAGLPSQPEIIYADIGPTRAWGRPSNYGNWHKFVDYSTLPWELHADLNPDLILIDGRFRPACLVAALVSITRPTLVIIDDYAGRPEYHSVEELTSPVERVGRMAVFKIEPRKLQNNDFLRLVRYFFDQTETINPEQQFKILRRLMRSGSRQSSSVIGRMGSFFVFCASPITRAFSLAYRNRRKAANWLQRKVRSKSQYAALNSYEAFKAGGLDAALSALPKAARNLPPALPEVFKAMAANNDEAWLAATNAWAAPRGAPEIILESGDAPRFQRIRFAPGKKVTDGDLVSVIIPCFNSEDTVERAVRSILDQSWVNIEVIAVNDASTDNTGEILEALARQDERLVVLHNKVNVGPYVSKNRALQIASGRYVTGHDADDLAFPDRIETQMAPINADPDCVATIGHMVRLDEDGRVSRIGTVTSKSFDGICWLCFISLLIDRNVLMQEVGYWDSVRFGADSELLARLTAVTGKKPVKVDKLLMLMLWSPASLTGNAVTGFTSDGRLTPVRRAYGDSWSAWHKSAKRAALRIGFPEPNRKFAAPPEMIVDYTTIERVLAAGDAPPSCSSRIREARQGPMHSVKS